MLVEVKLVGYLQKTGVDKQFFGGPVEVGEDFTIAQLMAYIGVDENAPWLITHNRALAEWDSTLADGDVVALIPPVNGGGDSHLRRPTASYL